jgi:phage gp36-like protein
VAYCTVEEVRGVLARDVLAATGTAAMLLDADLLDYHIASAQAELDARVAGRYVTPFTAPVKKRFMITRLPPAKPIRS